MRRGERRTQESALQQSKGAQRIFWGRGLARAGPTRSRAARIHRGACASVRGNTVRGRFHCCGSRLGARILGAGQPQSCFRYTERPSLTTMRRVWGHFRRGSDEELPSFEEAVAADARLRGAARLAVLDASRLQRRSARAFRSWNAHTVSLIVSDAREKQYAAQLRAKDGENAQKISEALSEAYAGHAAELAAQAREHEESKQLALAGQRASFEGKTPTKKKKTPGKGQHSDKLVERAFADRQSRHDDAIKSLRRSHDAKLVALKASHAKELTMVKTAIRLEKDQERAVAVNDALREAEKVHTERMKERTFVIEGRTPCKTPG